MSELFSPFICSYEKNCFSEHIRESIRINQKLRPLYAGISNGRSEKVFRFLINSEYVSLIPAACYDLQAAKFQRGGSSLLRHEFMAMKLPSAIEKGDRPSLSRKAFSWKPLKQDLSHSIQNNEDFRLRSLCLEAIKELQEQAEFYPMTRHLIESIYRFAYFLPLREEEASALKLPSPRKLIRRIMKLHLMGFLGSYQIDEWCSPLQEEGIPLLMGELPDLLQDLSVPSK